MFIMLNFFQIVYDLYPEARGPEGKFIILFLTFKVVFTFFAAYPLQIPSNSKSPHIL